MPASSVRRLPSLVVAILLAAALPLPRALGAQGSGSGFPIEASDDRGVPVRLARPPARVVSLAPNLTEIVFLLGKEKSLVGVTRFCNHPPAAARLPRVGGIVDPDVERIVAAAPDLVLCTSDGNPKERIAALEELGIPCFVSAPQTLNDVFALTSRVGALLGVPDRGRSESNALARRAAAAAGRPTNAGTETRSPKVLFVVSTAPIIAAGRGTFIDELIRRAGGKNVVAAGRYPRLGTEDLLRAAPDIIFVAGMTGVESFPPEVARWREVPAFRDNEVRLLDGDLVTRPGPRLVAALEEVSRAVAAWRLGRRAGRSS